MDCFLCFNYSLFFITDSLETCSVKVDPDQHCTDVSVVWFAFLSIKPNKSCLSRVDYIYIKHDTQK
jgi:hypothetical protein